MHGSRLALSGGVGGGGGARGGQEGGGGLTLDPDCLQVTHHGLEPGLLLGHLGLQLLHNLDLDLGLRRAPVVQHVAPVEVGEERVEWVAVGVAARPLAHPVTVEGVGGTGLPPPLPRPLSLLHQARVL